MPSPGAIAHANGHMAVAGHISVISAAGPEGRRRVSVKVPTCYFGVSSSQTGNMSDPLRSVIMSDPAELTTSHLCLSALPRARKEALPVPSLRFAQCLRRLMA